MSDDDRPEERDAREASRTSTGADPEARGRTGPLQFLKEVRGELRKVAWPNRKELVSYTIVVLVVSLVLTILVWGFDQVVRNAVINTLG
jgi:preprotein translocase subunit SecE